MGRYTVVTEQLHAGALRDALGAIGNLEQLLASRKVAPKTVTAVLPDILTGFEPLLDGLDRLFASLEQRFSAKELRELQSFVRSEVTQLSTAIEQAAKTRRAMTASTRLTLERAVSKGRRNLSGCLPLIELYAELAAAIHPDLDLVELLTLSRSGDQPQTPHAIVRKAGLTSSDVSVPIVGTPRALMSLIGLAASCLPNSGSSAEIALNVSADEGYALTIRSGPAEGQTFDLLLPPAIPPTATCLASVAGTFGLDIQFLPDAVCLRWAKK